MKVFWNGSNQMKANDYSIFKEMKWNTIILIVM